MYEPPQRSGRPVTVVAIVLGVVACLCACIAALGGGAVYLAATTNNGVTLLPTVLQITEIFQRPTETPGPNSTPLGPETATSGPNIILTPVPTPVAGSSD